MQTYEELKAERDELKRWLDQVDDVLVIYHVAVKDGDYRKALHDYAGFCIDIDRYFAQKGQAREAAPVENLIGG